MPKNPLCPYCNTELEWDDTYDTEYDEEGITLYQMGHCPKRNREYDWQSSACCIQWANTDLSEV